MAPRGVGTARQRRSWTSQRRRPPWGHPRPARALHARRHHRAEPGTWSLPEGLASSGARCPPKREFGPNAGRNGQASVSHRGLAPQRSCAQSTSVSPPATVRVRGRPAVRTAMREAVRLSQVYRNAAAAAAQAVAWPTGGRQRQDGKGGPTGTSGGCHEVRRSQRGHACVHHAALGTYPTRYLAFRCPAETQ